jgi:arylsulfatase A-like enzyme
VLDLTLRLDAKLGQLFDALDKRLGPDGWAAVVTSDHGATPLVERTKKPGSRRIPPDEIGRTAEEAMKSVLGDEQKWIADVTSSNVWLAPEVDPQDPTRRGVALDAAVEAIAKLPNIAAVGRTDLFGPCIEYQDLRRALCLSYVPGESGELYVVPEAGSLISEYKAGTHHDAPFDDNRLVPLFVKATGLHANATPGLASATQVAPTVCALLGVKPPAHATEKPLFGLAPR